MDSTDEKILLEILPDVAWKHVFANLLFDFPTLESCSKVSSFLDDLIKRNGHLSIISGRLFACVPNSVVFSLFPETILQKPQITVMNICVNPTFQPINNYLEWLIESQRDSLETLHITCFGLKNKPFVLVLQGMTKLRELKIVRNMHYDKKKKTPSLTFPESPSLPSLESLTLSAFGRDPWYSLLSKTVEHPQQEYSICETVKHLCLLPGRPDQLRWTSCALAEKFVFPSLVALEIPAMLLDWIYKMLPAPGNLKRLTLTLPTRGLHKHLFDVCITGYREQVCAAILAKQRRNPVRIRKKIGKENERRIDDFDECERLLITGDKEARQKGIRLYNLTHFTGLEEIRMKSDTGHYGPTLVSCDDLLSMESLKILRFSGFYPKYIPDKMMRKLRKRFTVETSTSDHVMDSNSKIQPHKQTPLEMSKDVWKQGFGCLSSSFQTVESCSEASNVFNDLGKNVGVLSFHRDKFVPSNFHNRISFHRGLTPIPRITTLEICVNSNFQPMAYYLNCLLESQRDSLEILRISCLGKRSNPLNVDLPEMGKLRDLKLVRNMIYTNQGRKNSLHFRLTAFLPALETLTLSAFRMVDCWNDFLEKTDGSEDAEYSICETIKHLRILPGRSTHVIYLMNSLSKKEFLNLVSLEIPAVLFYTKIHVIFSGSESLKRLTLTLPTRGLHKHLYDVCITGYGEQVCAAILANPDADPQEIRREIGEENERQLDRERDDFDYWWEMDRVAWDRDFRRQGRRWPNITGFLGLEELKIKSDTWRWGPTLVSCGDLLSMESLKSVQFCGHKPKYIPNDMINKMEQRFTVSWD